MAKLSVYPDLAVTNLDGSERLFGVRTGENFQLPLGLVTVSRAQITQPVEWIDMTLPLGFSCFLIFLSVNLSEMDRIGACLSLDGGTTWMNEDSSYVSLNDNSFTPLAPLTAYIDSVRANAQMTLYPGSPTDQIYLKSSFIHWAFEGLPVTTLDIGVSLVGYPTKMLLMPYGNGDVPCSSGRTFDSGVVHLLGIPVPAAEVVP
jgi:hypothetical protein